MRRLCTGLGLLLLIALLAALTIQAAAIEAGVTIRLR